MRSDRSARDTASSTPRTPPVLDQGIVITGDVLVKLMGLKLLPVKVRLLVSSTKLASELGLDWWREEQAMLDRRLFLSYSNVVIRLM